MKKVTKAKKTGAKINKNKESLMGLSMLGLSGFHICDIYNRKSAPVFFKRKREKKTALSY